MRLRTIAALIVAAGWALFEAGLAMGADAPGVLWAVRVVAVFILVAEAVVLLTSGRPGDDFLPTDLPPWVSPTLAEIAAHPERESCADCECEVCSVRDCPHGDPLHYHHDDCPSCWIDEASRLRSGSPERSEG